MQKPIYKARSRLTLHNWLPISTHFARIVTRKGKWSNLRLFHRGEGFALIERRNLRDAQLVELKKYAVFSKKLPSLQMMKAC